MKACFDPAAPKTLFLWRDVRPVSWDESQGLLRAGAKWMPLRYEPYDKTAAGTKTVEVRDTKPWLADVQAGRVVILGRGRTMPRLSATVAARVDASSFAAAPADWIARAHLGEVPSHA